ncbi:hypothetical protein MHYP_G00059830 [Metynnis hypsauchen]
MRLPTLTDWGLSDRKFSTQLQKAGVSPRVCEGCVKGSVHSLWTRADACDKFFRRLQLSKIRKSRGLEKFGEGVSGNRELMRDHIPKARDVGQFLSISKTVICTSMTKVLEYERDYMCNKCRHVFSVQADFEQYYSFSPPTHCPSEDECSSF